jgi:hypothetical protein
VIDNLQPNLGQASLIPGVERPGPRGVLAEDRRRLHVISVDQHVLGRIAGRLRQERGGEVALEEVFQVRVVVVDALGDVVAGRTRRDRRHFQPAGPGLQRQRHFGGVGRDHRAHLVLAGQPLHRPHGVGGGVVVVICHDFDHAAVDTALGVDLVGGDLRRVGDGNAGDGGVLGDHPDLDRVGRKRHGWQRECSKGGR